VTRGKGVEVGGWGWSGGGGGRGWGRGEEGVEEMGGGRGGEKRGGAYANGETGNFLIHCADNNCGPVLIERGPV